MVAPVHTVRQCALVDAVQTACTTVKHLSLGVAMLGCEDALVHLLNFVWPNIFETSPHVINAVFEAIEVRRTLQHHGERMDLPEFFGS